MSGFAPDYLPDKLGPNFERVISLRASSLQKDTVYNHRSARISGSLAAQAASRPTCSQQMESGIECWPQGKALAHIQRPF